MQRPPDQPGGRFVSQWEISTGAADPFGHVSRPSSNSVSSVIPNSRGFLHLSQGTLSERQRARAAAGVGPMP